MFHTNYEQSVRRSVRGTVLHSRHRSGKGNSSMECIFSVGSVCSLQDVTKGGVLNGQLGALLIDEPPLCLEVCQNGSQFMVLLRKCDGKGRDFTKVS